MKRKTFINRTLWGLGGLGFASSIYTWQIEPFWLEFVKVKMPIKNLPKHLVGKTLMQISDIHVGNRFDYHFIIESFKQAATFNPDFVVYTGDYVSTYKDKVQYEKLEHTLKNAVKGSIGTVAVLGNHDYGKNWAEETVADTISELLRGSGITVLRNQKSEFEGLHFIGFDDYWGLNFDPTEAMSGFNKNKANIVLCHNPDVCDLDVWDDYNSWILSGHTHGGQVKPPFLPPPILPVKNRRYSAGEFELTNQKKLYINRALGHLWQLRLNVRPEITLFQLQAT